MTQTYAIYWLKNCFWRLCWLVLAGLVAHEAHAQQAPPAALKFKWVGELLIVPPAGDPDTGHIEVGVGNFEAKTPNQVEFWLSEFSNRAQYVYKFLDASFAGATDNAPAFDVPAPFPTGSPNGSCPGTFHFVLLTCNGVDFLYCTFVASTEACRTTIIKAILVQKKVAKEHQKVGDYQKLISSLLRYAVDLPATTGASASTLVRPAASRSPTPAARSTEAVTTTAQGPGPGYTMRLAANPVVLEVDKLYKFNDGYAVVAKGSAQALIDRTGKIVVPFNRYDFQFNMGHPTNFPDPTYVRGIPWDEYGFIRGFCIVKDRATGKLGMLDTKLQVAIPCKYDNISYFNEQGFTEAGLNRVRVTLDRHGNVVANTKREFATSQGGYFGMTTRRLDGPSHHEGHYPSYGLYLVYGTSRRLPNEQIQAGFADRLGNLKIAAHYQNARPFYDGLAAVSKLDEFGKEKWGFINTKGEQVIEFKFSQEPGNFHNGRALVEPLQQDQYRYAYINKKGEPILFLRHDEDCRYNPAPMQMMSYNGVSNAYKLGGTFDKGYALWRKNCRTSTRNRAEGGTLVMDTVGTTFVLEQRLQRNGWPGSGFTPLTDFINNEIVMASGSGVLKAETKAIVTIQGDIIIKSPRGPGEWGDIYDLFDPVSQLTQALISKDNQETEGYVNREGVMTIVRGKGSKW